MKVLLIGSGGREAALAYRLRKSPLLKELNVFPGNGGFPDSELLPKNAMDLKKKDSVLEFVKKNAYDFVVVGPEDPLVDGITDWLSEAGIPCFGPSAYCAQLEGSKDFAKNLMKEFGVPTARSMTFSDYDSSLAYIEKEGVPIVVKADGLAAGKGVTVCMDESSAKNALKEIFLDGKFGKSGARVVIEEFMEGEEASIFALSDGERFLMFPAAQDHKRAFDGDRGPNTGGMGAYAPAPIVTPEVQKKVADTVFSPMLKGMREKGHPYKGLLYAGLMIDTKGNPRVVEFNVRFGDPETQALMLLLEDDLLQLMKDCVDGKLTRTELKIQKAFATVVVLAADGYPDSYKKNIELRLGKPKNGTEVFHAGTKLENGKVLSSGGRVLGITSIAEDLKTSVDHSYAYLKENPIPDTFYRKDIAGRAI